MEFKINSPYFRCPTGSQSEIKRCLKNRPLSVVTKTPGDSLIDMISKAEAYLKELAKGDVKILSASLTSGELTVKLPQSTYTSLFKEDVERIAAAAYKFAEKSQAKRITLSKLGAFTSDHSGLPRLPVQIPDEYRGLEGEYLAFHLRLSEDRTSYITSLLTEYRSPYDRV